MRSRGQLLKFLNALFVPELWPRSSARLEYWTFNPGVGGSNPLEAIHFLNNVKIARKPLKWLKMAKKWIFRKV